MNEQQYLEVVKKCADINLQLMETLVTLGETGHIQYTPELAEMIEYTLEINWQTYRLTSEKIKHNGFLL